MAIDNLAYHQIQRIRNRASAGRMLGVRLMEYRAGAPWVVALPRGGVPVAVPIARTLQAPLRLLLSKKISAPENPELAIGAVTSLGSVWFNEELIRQLHVSAFELEEGRQKSDRALMRQEAAFPLDLLEPDEIRGQTVILVDDGFATGATVFAAVDSLRTAGARKVVLAVPVISRSGLREVRKKVDQVEFLLAPEPFYAVAPWYDDFPQLSDEEVQEALRSLRSPEGGAAAGGERSGPDVSRD